MSDKTPASQSPDSSNQLDLFDDDSAYAAALAEVVGVLEASRRASVRSINAIMTATYWDVGRRIVHHEQSGQARADYGKMLIEHLATELSSRFGRGFKKSNLFQMRSFYLTYPKMLPDRLDWTQPEIFQTLSGRFPLPWSHYVKLLGVKGSEARAFYETEALQNGWSVRQLGRQIASQFYERVLLSQNKASMLATASQSRAEDVVTVEEQVKEPYVLEFLNLKDEYSENDLEEALIKHIEIFLLELGSDFAFVGRQRRLRIGDQWFRVDLVFFHRRLRCLVIIDLKLGEFTHADAGQMHLYLNYAREHWTLPGENPPVGLILCNKKDEAVAHYALDGLPNKVLAAEYEMQLPDEDILTAELDRTRRFLEQRQLNREVDV